tara:strand:+ start:168 stop:2126 length:1959 start_codon:yes stop_codon:yes gene_type:complete
MALDKIDIAGSIFNGWWKADKADSAQKLITRSNELQNKQKIIQQMKTNDYNKEIAKYDADKKVIDSLNAVAADVKLGKYDGSNQYQLGEAILRAKHGENFDKFKTSSLGAEGDPTNYNALALSEAAAFSNYKDSELFKNFKEKSVIDANYLAEIAKIEEETKNAIDAAAGDSKTVNAIINFKNKLIGNLKPDSKNVDVIEEVNTVSGSNEKDTLKKIESNIKTNKDTEVEASEVAEVKTESADVDLSKALESVKPTVFSEFIPKSFKDATVTPIKDLNNLDYSTNKYTEKFADAVIALIPNAKRNDFFKENDDGSYAIKEGLVGFNIALQDLLTNSAGEIDDSVLYSLTDKNKSRITAFTNANKRLQLASNYVDNYGKFFVDGKVFGDGGLNLSNIISKQTNVFVMPGQDVIDMNNNNLKGYNVTILNSTSKVDAERIKNFTRFTNETEDRVFNTRNFVGEVYLKYVIDEATKMGGNLESNMAAIQRQINNGNEEYVNGARDRIAAALGIETNKPVAENKTGSAVDESDKPLPSGKIKIQHKDGETKIVDDTPGNRELIDGENFTLLEENKIIKQDEKIIDSSQDNTTTQFLKSEAIKEEKIRPGGDAGQGEFQSLSEVRAILPKPMSGKELKKRYAIGFSVNDFTIYRPSK